MLDLFRRYGLLFALFLGLFINVAIYWPEPKKPLAARQADHSPLPPDLSENPTTPESQAREAEFQAALDKLPAEQRKVVVDRIQADRAFFASIKDLPEVQRREQLQEHFAQNPPPDALAGLPGGSPPNAGPGPEPGKDGGPGGPGAHVPPPDVRRSMDKHIADSQRAGGGQ